MNVKVLGTQSMNFKTSEGTEVKGLNLFVAFKDKAVNGMKAERFFINANIECPEIKPGDTIDVNFNYRGKIESIIK